MKVERSSTSTQADARPWRATPQGTTEPSEQSAVMNAVQKALTTARKADGRVRRLKEEQAHRQRQWTKWLQEQRENFSKQKKQYENDLQRISKDLSLAEEAGIAAAARVKEVVLGGAAVVNAEPAPKDSEDTEWDRLMTLEEDAMITETEGFYKEAVQAAQQLGADTSAREARPVDGAPPGLLAASPAPTMAYSIASPCSLHKDPYMHSPGANLGTALREAFGAAKADDIAQAPTTPPFHAAVPPMTPPRPSRPEPEPTTPLSEKLSAHRAARRVALQPFGGKPLSQNFSTSGLGGTGAIPAEVADAALLVPSEAHATATTESGLIDDDREELDDGAPSPGFGRLE